ncbi:hypothetical protein [Micromonospora lutea]|uniref:Uncharacterized protein n=1 Tax=Micromonospora lutea TaxID=419825 RepID=A0ABQ4IYB8_9ACTN|nr:hypothetical protein [Micromonospora lutea]GIJ22905.1 hypothetical protein Vlu01_35290 [Micromonospora lutea]
MDGSVLAAVVAVLGLLVACVAMIPDWAGLISSDPDPVASSDRPGLSTTATSAPAAGGSTLPSMTATSTPAEPAPAATSDFLPPEQLDRFKIPGGHDYAKVDFDSHPPRTWVDVFRSSGMDLEYSTFGLKIGDKVLMGSGPAKRPASPEECLSAAQTQSLGTEINHQDIESGMVLCVSTTKDNVAWLKLLRTRTRSGGGKPDLEFTVVVWHRR